MARIQNKKENNTPNGGARLGFESKLWEAAEKLRSNMDAAEYRHVVPCPIFLKYISDSFEEHFPHLKQEVNDPQSQWCVSGPEQQYLPQILREKGISREKWERMADLHALPEGWESLEYQEFPEQRRSLMAGIIRRGFEVI